MVLAGTIPYVEPVIRIMTRKRDKSSILSSQRRMLTALLAEAKRGSESALGKALQRCEAKLKRLAAQRLPDYLRAKESISDLVQETMLQGTRGFGQFRGETSEEFICWLRSILETQAQVICRRYHAQSRDIAREIRGDRSHGGSSPADHSVDPGPTPLELLSDKEVKGKLAGAIEQLDLEERSFVRWCLEHQGNLSWKEIGEGLGISEEAARGRWYRVIKKLKAKFEEHHDV